MKHMNRLCAGLLALLTLFLLVGCSAPNKSDVDGMYNGPNGYPSIPGEDAVDTVLPGDENGNEGEEGAWRENPFIATNEQNVSTFSSDVDTASYAYFRKLVTGSRYGWETLQRSHESFRTEEFVNYFRYESVQPGEGELFGVTTQIVPCPWNENTLLMRMTLQAAQPAVTVGNNLVFLIDVSGSMQSADKLGLLKDAFSYLTESLTANDVISIVTYSGSERVVLEGCPGNDTQRILQAINGLQAYGSTNGEAGLTRAYEIAERYRIEGGNNRIIMASDGDLNVGISSQSELTAFVSQKRATGVYLSVLGFGTGNYRDSKMEALADNGNGVYYYIDGMSEAEKVFGSDLLGTLYTVAEDVKLQVTFDPAYVSSYRLIGYENRILNEEDFEDDTKDAGDVGAGHRVTACYELTVNAQRALTEDADWLTLAVRYKHPGDTVSLLNEYGVSRADFSQTADGEMLFIASVIQAVMLLHGSSYADGVTLEGILETLNGLDLTAYPDRDEFREMLGLLAASTQG